MTTEPDGLVEINEALKWLLMMQVRDRDQSLATMSHSKLWQIIDAMRLAADALSAAQRFEDSVRGIVAALECAPHEQLTINAGPWLLAQLAALLSERSPQQEEALQKATQAVEGLRRWTAAIEEKA